MKFEDEDGVVENIEVIFPKGLIKKTNELDDKKHADVIRVIDSELGRLKTVKGEAPAHVSLMKQLEIAVLEPRVSDAGQVRWLPNGAFMCELFRRFGYQVTATDLDSYPVKTPMIINPDDPCVKRMMGAFPERLYIVQPGMKSKQETQEFRLRPACDYGVFSIFKDAVISYKNMPVRLYEYEDASWRYEQRGELLGLKRTRAFQMVDVHTMVEPGKPALDEFAYQMKEFGIRWYHELGMKPSGIVLNCMNDFYESNKAEFKQMADYAGLPIVVKLFTKMKTYKVAWFDVIAFDVLGRPIEVDTVQLDTKSPEWWGIKYVNEQGNETYPNIVHTGIGTNRAIMAILEWEAAKLKKGELPCLPLWIAPAQVRVLSVTDKNNKGAVKLCDSLNKLGVRAEVDDHNERLSRKMIDARNDWINYLIVFGDKEEKASKFKVSVRAKSSTKKFFEKQYSIKELADEIKLACKGKPYLPLPYTKLLSKRVKFHPWGKTD